MLYLLSASFGTILECYLNVVNTNQNATFSGNLRTRERCLCPCIQNSAGAPLAAGATMQTIFSLLPTALAFSIQTILPGPNCVISGPPSAPILSSFGFCRQELDPFAAHAMRPVGWHLRQVNTAATVAAHAASKSAGGGA